MDERIPIINIIILQFLVRFLSSTFGSHQVCLNCFKVSTALGPLSSVHHVLLKRDHQEQSVCVTAYVSSIASSLISTPPFTSAFFVRDLVVAAALEIVSVENLQQPFFSSTSRFKWIFVTEREGWTEMIRLERNDVRKHYSLTYLAWFSSQIHWLRMEASSSFDTRMQSGFSCHGLLYRLLYYCIIFSLGFKNFLYRNRSLKFRYCATLSHAV